MTTNNSYNKSISIRKSSGSDVKSAFKKVGSPIKELILAQEAVDNVLAAAPERKTKKTDISGAKERNPLSPKHTEVLLTYHSPSSPNRKNNFEHEGKNQLENLKKMIEMRIVEKNKISKSISKSSRNLSGSQKPKKRHINFIADETQNVAEEKPNVQTGAHRLK